MSHSKTVGTEFARQARTFASDALLKSPELTERIADALEHFASERILDVGCGPGVLTPVLGARARLLVGVDLTAEVVRLARERHGHLANVGFVRGVVERLPFAAASFDAVVLRLALHHFEHPADGLREVRRLIRRGGRVVVLDILTSDDAATAALHNAIEILRDPSHVRFVPLETLRETGRAAGLTLVREESWQHARDFTAWARVINEPKRMAALEVVLRQLTAAGIRAGIDLRDENGELHLDYQFGLLVFEAS